MIYVIPMYLVFQSSASSASERARVGCLQCFTANDWTKAERVGCRPQSSLMAVDRHLPARETSSSVSPFNKRKVTTREEEGRGEDIYCDGFNFSSTVYQACRNESFEHEETQTTTS